MRKLLLILLCLGYTPMVLFSQNIGGNVRASLVFQRWDIGNINDPISEGTMPVEVNYPVMENMHLQVNHFPAMAQFGDANMAGLSDTWIRGAYSFDDDRAMFSIGLGLPTGKTMLDSTQLIIARMLSQHAFKFHLPVYGQGLTLSAGIMYAYPVSENITVGAGLNYVFRNKYKYSTLMTTDYNPGDQIGCNVGGDFQIMDNFRGNVDFVFNYYTTDKLGGQQMFTSGPRFLTKIGLQYLMENVTYWLTAFYQTKAKNEIYSILNDKMEPEPKNSNITLRELHLGARITLSKTLAISILGEVRSYVENEFRHDWVDLAGGGAIGEMLISDQLSLFTGFKLFFGDGYFYHPDQSKRNPSFQGFEFQLGSQWNF